MIPTMLLLVRLIDLYSLIVIVAVIISWLGLPPYHPAVRLAERLTEPVLRPIRNVLPPMGGLDFSPLILLVGLQFVKTILV